MLKVWTKVNFTNYVTSHKTTFYESFSYMQGEFYYLHGMECCFFNQVNNVQQHLELD